MPYYNKLFHGLFSSVFNSDIMFLLFLYFSFRASLSQNKFLNNEVYNSVANRNRLLENKIKQKQILKLNVLHEKDEYSK